MGGAGAKGGAGGPHTPPLVKKTGDVEGLVGHIKERDKNLANVLESAKLSLNGTNLDITVDNEPGFLLVKKQFLEEACKEYFEKRVSVNIKTSGETKRTGRNAQPPRASRAGGDKLINDAVRIFGGKVIDDRGSNA